MKTLILVRHAESSSAIGNQSDFDRTLSEKGKLQAKEMQQHLQRFSSLLVLCSDSQRTRQTAAHLLENISHSIQYLPELYNASALTIQQIIEKHADSSPLMVIAHNPGISQLYHDLTQQWVSFEPCSIGIITLSNEENTLSTTPASLLGNFVSPLQNE